MRAGWIAAALLVVSGCEPAPPETISREAFIEAYVALRVAELTEPGDEMISAEARERVLAEQSVTEEELFGFVEVYGGDVDFMKEVWRDAEKRMEALRNPPDTTGVGGDTAASLPLDRCRRLRADVVGHAVDARDLVDDAGGHAGQEIGLEGVPVGSHAVA